MENYLKHDFGTLNPKVLILQETLTLPKKIMSLLGIGSQLQLHTRKHQQRRWRPHPNFRQPFCFLISPLSEQSFTLSIFYRTPIYSFIKYGKISNITAAASFSMTTNEEEKIGDFEEYLVEDGEVYQKTLRLVECSMFAAVSGLTFLLSNALAIEKYFACFFALPIVLSTMRWGIAAGRKTMVATFVLLFVISGPLKAITYLLLHGLLGFSIGAFWRSKTSWGTSIFLCTLVRAVGALSNVVIASYLIGENILALITINVHALATYILSLMGIVVVPSMNVIYFIFGSLLLLNCGSFVFLLHLLYAVFFTRLGMKAELRLPKWLEAAI